MKWILIVLIYQYNGGMVEKQFDMPNETACKLVAHTIKDDLRKAIELQQPYSHYKPTVVTTCTMVPPQ